MDHLLNYFNIRICESRTRALQIIIKVPCPLEIIKQCLYCATSGSFCVNKLSLKSLSCFKDTVVEVVKI